MIDLNNYWLLQGEDSENLRYVIDNFKALKMHVRSVREGRKELINQDLEGKTLDFEQKEKGYLFKVDGKELFYFEGIIQKGFDVRYGFNNVSKLVTVDYEKGEFMKIEFKGKIEVEPTEFERAQGIPFYRIKKS